MNRKAVFSIFKRDLGSYFGNPSGYVFICAFLLASGFAAFWPEEFFNANLANLAQLNQYLPHILLGFIPAITMSIWAEERNQGTDELLLTLPGSDLDVVMGKYLGAVAIFTVAIFLSLVSNTVVLYNLGNPDVGLLFANYFGAWMMGLAMIAVGMVASFLTANLTVAFVLGVALNTPLALASDWQYGAAFNFLDFNRGVISISGIAFFLGVAASMLYLCSILIGRRHWEGGPGRVSKTCHFLFRVLAAIVVALSLTAFFRNHDVIRIDATVAKLSQLSDGSINLLNNIEGTVEIEAYVSPAEDFPEDYIQVRANLMSLLRELDNEGGEKIRVEVFEIESTDPSATTAEGEGIENKNRSGLWVQEKGRGMTWEKDLYMGLVFRGSAGKKTLNFLYKGLPVEYELIRHIVAVGSKGKKKKIGVFSTDAPVMGSAPMGMFGFDMGGGRPPWDFIIELEKQYDVQAVTGGSIREWRNAESGGLDYDGFIKELENATETKEASSKLLQLVAKQKSLKILPASLIKLLDDGKYPEALSQAKALKVDYDALIVIQPSTLDNGDLEVLLDEIRRGIPTAIFEDPLPILSPVTGTYDDRRNNQQQRPTVPGQRSPSPPKGQISKLWELIGVHFNAEPETRLDTMIAELNELEQVAKTQLRPMMGFKPVQDFMKKLVELQANVEKLKKKLMEGNSLSSSDWDSIDIATLREPVKDLDRQHPLRQSIENGVIPDVEQRLKGLEKRVLWDTYNPFPKISKGKGQNFPDEFLYLGGKKESLSEDLVSSKLQFLLFTE